MKIGKKIRVHVKRFKTYSSNLFGQTFGIHLLPSVCISYEKNEIGPIKKSFEIHFYFLVWNMCAYLDVYDRP